MPIQRLAVDHLRNLKGVDIYPSSELNFIFGENGSGKTSLLEAISVLAHGRSFRTHKFRHLIEQAASAFSVFAQLDATANFARLGVNRARQGDAQYRLNGSPVYSSAALANQLPTQIMNAHSFNLLEGSSKTRRQLFDWLVFHVKHEFGALWRDYARCVKHRNSLLRRDRISRPDLLPWDREMARLAEQIHAARAACLGPYLARVNRLLSEGGLPDQLQIAFDYQAGWDLDQPLLGQLEAAFLRDLKYGFSTLGAHKSELKITAQRAPAHEILSRGQQKTLIAALYMAELQVYQELTGMSCVLLVDDLPAELDKLNIALMGRWINELNVQVFITGIDLSAMLDAWPTHNKQVKVFHVKHGLLNEHPA
jgi:DNA replication and repair protein RecF